MGLSPDYAISTSTFFASLRHVRELISAWHHDYKHHRPHSSRDGLTP